MKNQFAHHVQLVYQFSSRSWLDGLGIGTALALLWGMKFLTATLVLLALPMLSSLVSAQDLQTRSNPYMVPHCKTAQECVARYEATMALVSEAIACTEDCDAVKATARQLIAAAQHLSDRADELEAKEKKASQVASDSEAWRMAMSAAICSLKEDLQDSNTLMADQAATEQESGVINLRERHQIGRQAVVCRKLIGKAQAYLARHKMKAIPCAEIPDTLPENVKTLMAMPDDEFFSAK